MLELGAVGDICSRILKADGSICSNDLNSRTIGIELEELKRKPYSIAVAGGKDKLSAIKAALNGKWFNCLITDEWIATELLTTKMSNTKQNLIIAIGADHGGYNLKNELKNHLMQQNISVIDCGTNIPPPASVDYPKFAIAVAEKVANHEATYGIMIDGAGIGSVMTANKINGIRAALCYDISTANNAREHNNANVLTLGAGLIGVGLAKQIVDTFIKTNCTEERHLKRVAMIDELDSAPPKEFQKKTYN